ncbi:MAG TPA: hypothetical protein VLZ78_12315 [Terrimesophilobacter sp.]|nr:hypothetical protein [Terrimesophilobacter sp.]
MGIIVDGIDLEVIDRTGVYDYEWSEFAVMRGSDGHLYVGHTSGCSCNDFEENLTEVVRVGSWQEAADHAKRWAEDEDGAYLGEESQAGMNLIERLAKSRPAAVVSTGDAS